MISLVLLFLSLFSLSLADVINCLKYSNSSTGIQAILQNSAKRQFDLGLFDTCEKDPDFHFLVFNTNVPFAMLSTGLCVPTFCTAEDFNSVIIPYVLYPLAPTIFNPKMITAVDTKQLQKSFDGGSITIVTILALLVAVSLVAPIYKVFNGLIPKKEAQESQKNLLGLEMEHVKEDSKKESLALSIFNAFSFELNFKKMFVLREGKLDFFNCLRALSLFYVVFGHEFLLRVNLISNPNDLQDYLKQPIFLLASGGFYAVDVFYYLSGFFMAFVLVEGDLR